MLEHASLLLHPWTRTALQDGPTWIRPITDDASQPLGFVRYQLLPALSWLFWLRKVRLDVFETEDASHLMTLTRSWTMIRIWELHDAEDRHVGSVYPKSLITDEGEPLGYIDFDRGDQGCVLDPTGKVLLHFAPQNGACIELTFAPESARSPFLRMLLLGCILTLDPKPRSD